MSKTDNEKSSREDGPVGMDVDHDNAALEAAVAVAAEEGAEEAKQTKREKAKAKRDKKKKTQKKDKKKKKKKSETDTESSNSDDDNDSDSSASEADEDDISESSDNDSEADRKKKKKKKKQQAAKKHADEPSEKKKPKRVPKRIWKAVEAKDHSDANSEGCDDYAYGFVIRVKGAAFRFVAPGLLHPSVFHETKTRPSPTDFYTFVVAEKFSADQFCLLECTVDGSKGYIPCIRAFTDNGKPEKKKGPRTPASYVIKRLSQGSSTTSRAAWHKIMTHLYVTERDHPYSLVRLALRHGNRVVYRSKDGTEWSTILALPEWYEYWHACAKTEREHGKVMGGGKGEVLSPDETGDGKSVPTHIVSDLKTGYARGSLVPRSLIERPDPTACAKGNAAERGQVWNPHDDADSDDDVRMPEAVKSPTAKNNRKRTASAAAACTSANGDTDEKEEEDGTSCVAATSAFVSKVKDSGVQAMLAPRRVVGQPDSVIDESNGFADDVSLDVGDEKTPQVPPGLVIQGAVMHLRAFLEHADPEKSVWDCFTGSLLMSDNVDGYRKVLGRLAIAHEYAMRKHPPITMDGKKAPELSASDVFALLAENGGIPPMEYVIATLLLFAPEKLGLPEKHNPYKTAHTALLTDLLGASVKRAREQHKVQYAKIISDAIKGIREETQDEPLTLEYPWKALRTQAVYGIDNGEPVKKKAKKTAKADPVPATASAASAASVPATTAPAGSEKASAMDIDSGPPASSSAASTPPSTEKKAEPPRTPVKPAPAAAAAAAASPSTVVKAHPSPGKFQTLVTPPPATEVKSPSKPQPSPLVRTNSALLSVPVATGGSGSTIKRDGPINRRVSASRLLLTAKPVAKPVDPPKADNNKNGDSGANAPAVAAVGTEAVAASAAASTTATVPPTPPPSAASSPAEPVSAVAAAVAAEASYDPFALLTSSELA